MIIKRFIVTLLTISQLVILCSCNSDDIVDNEISIKEKELVREISPIEEKHEMNNISPVDEEDKGNNDLIKPYTFSNEELNVISKYTYSVEFENWGKVQFVSVLDKDESNIRKLKFVLADNENNIVYEFPEFYGNIWVFSYLDSIVFQDLNNDGKKDIVIIAYYIRGYGDNAAAEFPVVGVYFQQGNEFVTYLELNEELNNSQNFDVENVLKRIKELDLSLYSTSI